MNDFWKTMLSGLGGVILTLIFEFFFVKPQSFTFVYNGNDIVVTESSYTELVKNNENLQANILSLEEQVKRLESELETNHSLESITQIMQSASMYWNNSEFIQALTILKNGSSSSDEIFALYQNYSKEYCTYVLGKVDNLLSDRKYNDAKELLIESKSLVADGTILENRLNEINNNMPQRLSNIKISSSRYFDLCADRPLEDSVGNKYSSGNVFVTRAEGDTGYGYAAFYLGQKYTSLSGTIAVSDESENRSDTQLDGCIEIYSKTGDDYTHLYSSPPLNRMTNPITASEINLNGADWLEIRYYNNGNYFSLAGGYHSLEILLADFMIYSD